jgi:TonB family protein
MGTPRGTAPAGTASTQQSGVGVDVKTPTAKPAGSTTSGSAPGSTAGTSSTLNKEIAALDKALASAGPGKTAATGSGSPAGTGSRPFSVAWDDPDAGKGRELLSAAKPNLPRWVAEQGLTLTIDVAFTILPEGIVARASAARSTGYPEVDKAVLEAVRRWLFSAADTTRTVGGTIQYTIRVD